MRSYSAVVSQSNNAAMNLDTNRTASLREEKLKRKLMEIEKTGAEQLKQQELANKGASDVQGLRNTGELANTQLTGDIQSGLRESMIKENMSKAGLNETTGKLYNAESAYKDSQTRLQQLEGDVTQRLGMDIANEKLAGVKAGNQYTAAQASGIEANTDIQRKKAEGWLAPNATEAELRDRLYNLPGNKAGTVTPESPISLSVGETLRRGSRYIANPVGGLVSDLGEGFGNLIKKAAKKVKVSW